MCTVTLIPLNNNNFVLTSNRDEAPNRLPIPPDFYSEDNVTMLYPKDRLAGGTWIGVSENKRLICLLNGGFGFHERKAEYRQSRGVVVKDLLALKSIQDFKAYNFFDIEPFTLVITDWNSKLAFYELVWDGKRAHFNQLELNSHIWSSSTLYSKEKRLKRKKWFAKFEQNNALSADSVLLFHKTAGKGNDDFGVIMDRGYVKTTSITQVIKNDKDILLRYESFQENSVSLESFKSSEVINEYSILTIYKSLLKLLLS